VAGRATPSATHVRADHRHPRDARQKAQPPLFDNRGDLGCSSSASREPAPTSPGSPPRAERDGDEWLTERTEGVTTLAHISAFGLIVARTTRRAQAQGLTAFLVDMKAPGVEGASFRYGRAEFNEVFFTGRGIPEARGIGAEARDGAWRDDAHERACLHRRAVTRRGGGPVAEAIRIWKERWQGDTSPMPSRCATGSSRATSARGAPMTNMRAAQTRKAGTPGRRLGGQLAYAEENKRVYDLCMDLAGQRRHALPAGYRWSPGAGRDGSLDVRKLFLRCGKKLH